MSFKEFRLTDVKVGRPLILRATGFLYRKAHIYNPIRPDGTTHPLRWSMSYLMSAVEHFHLAIQGLYIGWKSFLYFLCNHPISLKGRDGLNRVFRRPKAIDMT